MSAPAPSPLAIVDAEPLPRQEEVLTDAALAFVAELHRRFTPRRDELLARRAERRAEIARTRTLDFLPETAADPRRTTWRVAPAPAALDDRRVEITGPTDRKMTINALNSGARVWLADFEDASAPTWENVVLGQLNLIDAYERRHRLHRRPDGQVVRAAAGRRAGHRRDAAARLAPRRAPPARSTGAPVPGALVDFGLYFFHNARRLLDHGQGPVLLPPEDRSRTWRPGSGTTSSSSPRTTLGIPQGTVRATVLIETITAAYEMEEILYELRDHASGLNAGRWDYLFSIVKNFRDGGAEFVLPGPQRGDDDRAVHARLHRTARPHLPQARRARDRRHGGLHPVPPRRRGQQGRLREGQGRQGPRGRRRLRRLLGRPPRPGPDRHGLLRRGPRRPAEPEGPAARGRLGRGGRPDRHRLAGRRAHVRRDCATPSRSASATSRPGCAASAPSPSST